MQPLAPLAVFGRCRVELLATVVAVELHVVAPAPDGEHDGEADDDGRDDPQHFQWSPAPRKRLAVNWIGETSKYVPPPSS